MQRAQCAGRVRRRERGEENGGEGEQVNGMWGMDDNVGA